MTKAIASRTQVSYIAEATENTTPATPALKILRVTGETLDAVRKYVYSSELDGLRGQKNAALSHTSGAGGLNFEYTYGTLDDMIASALRNTWSTNTITDAQTPFTFSIEALMDTGATKTYKRMTGAQVNTLNISAKAGAVATGTLALLSRAADFSQAAITGATYTAGNVEPIFIGANVGAISLGALTFDSVTSIDLQVHNNIRLLDTLGNVAVNALAAGKLEVTGTISMFLADTDYNVIRAGLDSTPTSLAFTIGTVTGKKTIFTIPNVILEAPKVDSPNADGDIMANFTFRALQATSIAGSVIQIQRNQ